MPERRGDGFHRLAVGERAALLQQPNRPLLAGPIELRQRRAELPLEIGDDAIEAAGRFPVGVSHRPIGRRLRPHGNARCQTDPGHDLAVPAQCDVVGVQVRPGRRRRPRSD